MIIRRAETTDALDLSEFARRTFYQSYAWYNTEKNMHDYVTKYFNREKIIQEINTTETDIFIAFEEDKMCGYAKLGFQNNLDKIQVSHSEIERIYVDEKIQRKGIGLKLLHYLISRARERNNAYIWLGVWQKNEKAISFYLKNGFQIIGTTQFILGDDVQDDFIMSLKIS